MKIGIDLPLTSNLFSNFNFISSWLARTDPADVARVESRTVISTPKREDTVPTPKDGVKGTLGFCF